MDVAEWLRKLGLEQHEPAFRENKVTADLLPSLTAEDLKDLGIPWLATVVGCWGRSLPSGSSQP